MKLVVERKHYLSSSWNLVPSVHRFSDETIVSWCVWWFRFKKDRKEPPPMTDPCREAFDKWCRETGDWSLSISSETGECVYRDIATKNAWNVWQAAWTANHPAGVLDLSKLERFTMPTDYTVNSSLEPLETYVRFSDLQALQPKAVK